LIARRSVLTFGIQMIQVASGVAIAILVTRLTGAHGKGAYSLMGLVVSIATLAAGLGIGSAAIYHIGRKTFPLEKATGTLVTVTLASTVVSTAAVGLTFLLFSHSYFHEITNVQLWIGLAGLPFFQLATGAGNILLGLNRVVQFAVVNLFQVVVTLCIQLGLTVAGRLTLDLALGAWVIGLAAGLVLSLSMIGRRASLRPAFEWPIFRSYVSYGAQAYIANLLFLFNYRLDSLIVNGLIGVASLGIYSIAVSMAELLWYLANSISLVMFPHISGLSRAEADRITPIVTRNTLLMTLIAAIAMFLLGRWIILVVFGPAMLPALLPLWLLLPGIVTLSAGKVISSYLSGIGRPRYGAYLSVPMVVLTVIFDVVLIPRFGIAGAAIASSIVYSTATGVSLWVFLRMSGRGLWETLVVQPEDFNRYRQALRSMRRQLAAVDIAH
jgi:stage V sporulation protein B